MVWRCCSPWARLLSPCWEQQLSNGSASARVPGLVGTSTYNRGSDPECISVSPSVLSSRPGIGVLSDTSMDHPCGRRIDAAVTAQRLSAWTLKGTLPPRTHLPAGDRRPHSPGGRGSWWGWGRWRPSGLSVDERERVSPGSPSEMSLSLPSPRDILSLRGHAPSPGGSNLK